LTGSRPITVFVRTEAKQTHARARTHTHTHIHAHTQTSTIPVGFHPTNPVFDGSKAVKTRTVRPTRSQFAAYVSVNNKA